MVTREVLFFKDWKNTINFNRRLSRKKTCSELRPICTKELKDTQTLDTHLPGARGQLPIICLIRSVQVWY